MLIVVYTSQKMKFFIKGFFSKCNQICRKLRIGSHFLKKSLMENFFFCTVLHLNFWRFWFILGFFTIRSDRHKQKLLLWSLVHFKSKTSCRSFYKPHIFSVPLYRILMRNGNLCKIKHSWNL